MNYTIVGNSSAAIGAVEAIRAIDPDGQIVLISSETEHTYSRPLISYRLAGKVDDDRMAYRPDDFYHTQKVQTMLGETVVGVDTEKKTLQLASERTLSYDKLLLATGGTPIVPPIKGLEKAMAGVFTFTSYGDVREIEAYLDKRGNVRDAIVLGGGMIGLKTAEALLARGMKVTIVELADRLLSASFDKTASQMMVEALERKGAAVTLQTTIADVFGGSSGIKGVHLSSGSEIYCQMLVLAIGVRPNVGYLKGSPVEVNRGIVVDERMQTNVADVYAAGDVAEAYDLLLEAKRPIPILPLAYRQGMIAGRNMAGHDETYRGGLAMNAIEVCGLPTVSLGESGREEDQEYEVMTFLDARAGVYKKVVIRGGRVVGLILVGEVDRAGIYTGLIERKVDVSSVKHMLLSDAFGLLSLDPQYRKHMVSGPGIEV